MPVPAASRFALLRPHLRRHRLTILAALALGAAAAALGAIEPLFLKYLTDLMVQAVARGVPAGAAARLALRHGLAAMALLGVALGVQRGLQTAQAVAVNRARFDSSFDLSSRLLHRLYTLPLHFHQQRAAGYLLTRVDRGIAALGQLTGEMLQSLLPNLIQLALLLAMLFALAPQLGWVALAPLPLFLWATRRGARRVAGHETAVQEGWSRLYSRVTEVLDGIKTVKSVAAEEGEIEEYRRRARRIFRRLWKQVWVEEGYGQLKGALALGGRLAVGGYGLWLVLRGAISPGAWVAATTYAALVYGPLAGLAGAYSTVARQWATAGATLDFLAGETAAAPPRAAVARLPRLRGEVAFENVSFSYPPAAGAEPAAKARPALAGVSFRIEAGETVVLVGPSGGGKTTLADLVLRFHDPDAGRVRIDGRDLRTISAAELRRQTAVVLQEPFLLEGTIAANLAYGCPDPRAVTGARLRAALRAAQAEEFVARLPEGLETRLGARGARLSGGERQRLNIARALLRDPRILILDEATAHLDPAAEAALHAALRALVEGRTAIVISHRLAMLPAAGRIFVIRGGRLVEQGTPAELAASGGFWAQWGARGVPEAAAAAV
jgi:ATP-binding cassette subfamily B protein